MASGRTSIQAFHCFPPSLATGGCRLLNLLRVALEKSRGMVKDPEEAEEELREEQPAILCRNCGHAITSGAQQIEIAGSHRHTFFNPVGIVYELGCFARAPGCSLAGEASDEFSWFPGYVWQIALCARCTTHLGWQFQGSGRSFYGLILSRLQYDGK